MNTDETSKAVGRRFPGRGGATDGRSYHESSKDRTTKKSVAATIGRFPIVVRLVFILSFILVQVAVARMSRLARLDDQERAAIAGQLDREPEAAVGLARRIAVPVGRHSQSRWISSTSARE